MTTTKKRTLSLVVAPAEPAQQALVFGPAHRVGDEVFPADEATPTARTKVFTYITCRVCNNTGRVPVTHPALLCEACFSDLVLSEQSLTHLHDSYNRRAQVVADEWHAALAAFEPATLARWERAEQAGVEPPQAFAASWAGREQAGTPIARLLCAWEAMQRECEAIEHGRAQIAAGQREIELARRVASGDTSARPPVGWRITHHAPRYLLHGPNGSGDWFDSYDAALAAAWGRVEVVL